MIGILRLNDNEFGQVLELGDRRTLCPWLIIFRCQIRPKSLDDVEKTGFII